MKTAGQVGGRRQGVLVSMETGKASQYGIMQVEDRGTIFIDPGVASSFSGETLSLLESGTVVTAKPQLHKEVISLYLGEDKHLVTS